MCVEEWFIPKDQTNLKVDRLNNYLLIIDDYWKCIICWNESSIAYVEM